MQEAKNPSESPRNERLDSPLALEVNDNETIGSRRRGNVRECPCFISSSWADRSESSSRKVWKAGPCMQGRQAGRCDPGMPASSGVITVDTVAGSTAEGLEHVTFEPSGQTGGDSRSVHFRFHTLISPCQLQLYFFTIQTVPLSFTSCLGRGHFGIRRTGMPSNCQELRKKRPRSPRSSTALGGAGACRRHVQIKHTRLERASARLCVYVSYGVQVTPLSVV